MDMILISDTKLKVMLSPLDMEELALSGDDIDYNNTETRRAFWSILDEAKHKTGFDAARTRVFIQVYPSKSGGCELYVTKLASRNAASHDSRHRISCRVKRTSDTSESSALSDVIENERGCVVYRFRLLDALLGAANKLCGIGYDGESSAYTDGTHYYLALSYCGIYDRPNLDRYAFVGEYGESLDRNILKLYIHEHCKCICASDAVKMLDSVS